MSRVALVLVAVVVAVSAVGAIGCTKKSDNNIKVGAYLSLSGPDSTFGTDTRAGIELALAEVNATGGIQGKKVRVLYEDDKSTTQEASQKVRQLIDRDKVVAVLGEVASSRTLAGGLVANTKHVPLITPSSTAVEVTQGRDWVFRVCFTDDQQGRVAARFVKNDLKKTKGGIFFAAQDTYSSGLAKSFRDEFKKLGGEIVIDEGYQKGETNFTSYLNELKSNHPEIVFVPNYYNEMVQIARQAKQVGLPGATFVGGDGWDSANLLEGAGAELEGAYFTNHYAPDVPWENSKKFVDRFHAKYKQTPSSLAAQGYDAAGLLFDAMRRAPVLTPEAIRKAIAETKNFAGATGTLTMDANRNAEKPIVLVKIQNKKFMFATQVSAN
jgi:branched-chain amino acid transport system substrate-binding protein